MRSRHLKLFCQSIHVVDEAFIRELEMFFHVLTINNHFPIIGSIKIAFLKIQTEKLSNRKGCIITTWQHHGIKQINQYHIIIFQQVSTCSFPR